MGKGLMLAAALLAGCAPKEALFPVGDFQLTAVGSGDTRPFSRADMKGSVWIVDFIFTSCGGPCPALTERLRALGEKLPEARLLSVSVDPAEDTPERLRAYAKAHGADLSRWVFARGTPEQTYNAAFAAFRLPMSTQPDAPKEARVTHSTRLALVDATGGVRGFYDGLDEAGNAALARDARRLLEEGK